LGKKAILPKSPNNDLKKGFSVVIAAKMHDWPVKLKGINVLSKCKELQRVIQVFWLLIVESASAVLGFS